MPAPYESHAPRFLTPRRLVFLRFPLGWPDIHRVLQHIIGTACTMRQRGKGDARGSGASPGDEDARSRA